MSENEAPITFPDPPGGWTPDDVYEALRVLSAADASDIKIASGFPLIARIHGVWYPVSKRIIRLGEAEMILDKLRMESSSGQLRGGEDLDFAIGVNILTERGKRVRFRVNATSTVVGGSHGVDLVFRTLPSLPPKLEDMALPQGLIDALYPKVGLVLVVGATGTGKSTLMASALRNVIENIPGKHILTYESPIEFVYDDLPVKKSFISQTSIPEGLPTYARGVRNSLRRAPSLILVGEARDPETISGTIAASQNGHAVYSTVHVNDVSTTISRMVGEFPASERQSVAMKLLDSMRMIVHQRLVRSPDGSGRVAIREYLAFDTDVRDTLYNEQWDIWPGIIREIMKNRKTRLKDDVAAKVAEGILSKTAWMDIAETLTADEIRAYTGKSNVA